MRRVLLDTGPLVSLLSRETRRHEWVVQQWKRFDSSVDVLTCEPVFTEAAFLLRRDGLDTAPLFALLERGAIRIGIALSAEVAAIRVLTDRYSNIPMSLADACLVRMSELSEGAAVFTLDRAFLVYRRHGNKVIPTLMP